MAQNDQNMNLEQMMDFAASILFKEKRFDLAAKQVDILLKLDPTSTEAMFNGARCHYYNRDYKRALELIKKADFFESGPGNKHDIQLEKALILSWLGEHRQAYQILNSLEEDDRVLFNLGWHMLRQGKIKDGFELLERGRSINVWGGATAPKTIVQYDGTQPLSKKSIVIINEGGNGDEIIFARFAKYLKQLGASRVDMLASKQMVDLLQDIDGIDSISAGPINEDDSDFWVPSMSLPYVLGIDEIDGTPYIKPKQHKIDEWRDRLILNPDRKHVGVRWQGGPLFEYDQRRTLPIDDLCRVLQRYSLISLQKESDDKYPDNLRNLENSIRSWDDTAAIIHLMDFVVTSCTAVAHLAGAMGKKTIVITPIVPYFTWAEKGIRTPWYDSVTVLSQMTPYHWCDALSSILLFTEK